jgi:putative ATPase
MERLDLFAGPLDPRPLAERMRPRRLEEMLGQEHLLGEGAALGAALRAGHLHSMVLWGPPGTGKTSLARLAAEAGRAEFEALSAVTAGLPEVRKLIREAEQRVVLGTRTLLFIDEVHRFNKAQQDAFLPAIERGSVVFVGATTENPSFELNAALLSRCRVYVLRPLAPATILAALERALADPERGLGGRGLSAAAEALAVIAEAADGDLRRALTMLELAAELARGGRIDRETAVSVASDRRRRFDKGGEQFYDQISALHKSVRSSDPDAALYWLGRMLDGGADPDYLARRLARMAVEDVGLADPRALQVALAAWQAYERIGSPEGELALAQAAVYLACAPKSNALYRAFREAMEAVSAHGSLPVPLHLRNAPTRLMRELGYGVGYRYDHDEAEGVAFAQRCLPEELGERVFYEPGERGAEARLREWLRELRERRRQARAAEEG